MSWRTVVISQRCKLDLKMGYMVIRGDETKRIFIDEISVLIIENNAVSLTACLLEALVNKRIKVVFCDSKRNPHSELIPTHGSHDSSRKIREQIKWKSQIKAIVWTEIVTEKIRNQMKFLIELGNYDAASLLNTYILEMQLNDSTNREGHAAKVYFNSVFGLDFSRSKDCNINSALNYGYNVLLSFFNREVSANGYLTQLGLFHDNMFNFYNLSSDLMEPVRVAIDRCVYSKEYEEFGPNEKHGILEVFNSECSINSSTQTLANAIKIYTRSVFEAIENEDISLIKFINI